MGGSMCDDEALEIDGLCTEAVVGLECMLEIPEVCSCIPDIPMDEFEPPGP